MAVNDSPARLPERQFAKAKSQLTEVMNEVVREHRPLVVDRHRGRERAVLVEERDLESLLEPYGFEPVVHVHKGEFVVRLPELNLIAGSADLEAAIDELVALAEEYADVYLERVSFYRQTDRRDQLPWVLRIALTPPDSRRRLIAPEHGRGGPDEGR